MFVLYRHFHCEHANISIYLEIVKDSNDKIINGLAITVVSDSQTAGLN